MIQDQDFKYRPKREEMVAKLQEHGITNKRVLEAFRKVKRHLFMDNIFWDRAYEDSALPISCSQTISQPYTVAYMTSIIASYYPTGKILEIGTGSGYQAAILYELGYKVFTIERIPALHNKAKKLFESLGLRIATRLGDGTLGWHEMAPYDAVIVTAGSPDVPQSLLEQLNDNGRLIIPVGSSDKQQMMIYHRQGNTVYESATNYFAFVPLIGKEGWKE
ncbi:MAG: protein-L-isoaspartate(D-aspartate) O-methyltransferase [Chlorobiales bacterium]|nr:protein-L-isoaspartate(D-aspartate) O-methyltransferase [Chlorobiales bacterium]